MPKTATQSQWEDLVSRVKAKASSADLATVATSGSYNDLSNKPTIPTVNNATLTIQKNGASVQTFTANSSSDKTANIIVPTKTSDITNNSGYITKSVSDLTNYTTTSSLAAVATSGDYEDLTNKPAIPAAQIQSNWTQTNTASLDYIKNKPTLATVATSGSYNDLSNKPTIPTVPTNVSSFTNDADYQSGTQVSTAISNAVGQITQFDYQVVQTLPSTGVKGTIYLVSNSGTSPNVYDEYIWIVNGSSGTFEKIGTTEVDLSGYVTDTELTTALSSYTPTSGLATVATSGSYSDLSNKPTIPAAQVNSDWNATSGVAQILNKPTIPTKCFYGTCSTAKGTAAKVVACADFTTADLVAGTRIVVRMSAGNTFNGQATLNINHTGAHNIYYNGTSTSARYMWNAGESVDFIFNGSQWATVNGALADTTYYGVTKLYTGAGSSSTSLALTPNSLYAWANNAVCPYYSASATYSVGDKVRYGNLLYECNTDISTAEAWNVDHWTQLDPLQTQIDNIFDEAIFTSSQWDALWT